MSLRVLQTYDVPMTLDVAKRLHASFSRDVSTLTPSQRKILRQATQVIRTHRKPSTNRRKAASNPRGERIGEIVELRYNRTVGKHRGLYKHVFSSRAGVWCLPDGNILIKREAL
jgi:hypothetical protein